MENGAGRWYDIFCSLSLASMSLLNFLVFCDRFTLFTPSSVTLLSKLAHALFLASFSFLLDLIFLVALGQRSTLVYSPSSCGTR